MLTEVINQHNQYIHAKVIVFDWDGTLSDSVSIIIKCKILLAKKYGLTAPSAKTVKSVLGMDFKKAMSICFPDASEEILIELMAEFISLIQLDKFQADIFPHVKQVLSDLKKRHIKLTIATSKSRQELDRAITYSGLSGLFDITCCGAEYESKPNPSMLNHIMNQCKVKPDECLMVGDTTIDMVFAANAGVKAIGVTFGAHSVKQLQATHSVALINDWMQLLNVI